MRIESLSVTLSPVDIKKRDFFKDLFIARRSLVKEIGNSYTFMTVSQSLKLESILEGWGKETVKRSSS